MNIVWLALAIVGQHWLDAKPTERTAPTEAGDRMTATTDESTRDVVAAECRRLMLSISMMQVRGFDTQRARAEEVARLDRLLDIYNALPVEVAS